MNEETEVVEPTEAPKRRKIYKPRAEPTPVDQDRRCSCGSRLCMSGAGQYECNGCGFRTR